MKSNGSPVIILLVIGLAIFLAVYSHDSNEKDAVDWVNRNGEKVIDTNRGFFDTGPYWHAKNVQFVRIETDKGNVYWFRYGWGRTIKQELKDGSYQLIEE